MPSKRNLALTICSYNSWIISICFVIVLVCYYRGCRWWLFCRRFYFGRFSLRLISYAFVTRMKKALGMYSLVPFQHTHIQQQQQQHSFPNFIVDWLFWMRNLVTINCFLDPRSEIIMLCYFCYCCCCCCLVLFCFVSWASLVRFH